LSIAAFDTHAFVKRLTSVGMPEPQAEALADEQVRLIDDRVATKEDVANLQAEIAKLQLVTQADIAKLQSATQADIAKLQAATQADIAKTATKTELVDAKFDIIKWTCGMVGFQTVIILGAVIALARLSH
jgi:hypothetical protein